MNVVNRFLAVVLALVLFLGGLLAAVEIFRAQVGDAPWLVPWEKWSTWLGTQTWVTNLVRAVLVGIGIVGLLLLVAALRRGRPGDLVLPAESALPGVRTTVSRRGVEKSLETAARDVDGVRSARADAHRHRVTVRASSMTREGEPEQRVRQAVTERLAALGLEQSLRPRVTMRYEERR
ncbi:DUF6286 domain-containing protein [Xylanimonas sp. McL0601]|uniref:DUF6286 domain-containing protein n=1 Tax=Xylanimonas sp. McL0601 TaxID=3414739 RepID=UPI003CED7743